MRFSKARPLRFAKKKNVWSVVLQSRIYLPGKDSNIFLQQLRLKPYVICCQGHGFNTRIKKKEV